MRHDWAELDYEGSGNYDCVVCDMNVNKYSFDSDEEAKDFMRFSECRGPVKPTKDLKETRFGWLSPTGELYACTYYGHLHLAGKLAPGYRPDDTLLEKGWARLSDTYSNR